MSKRILPYFLLICFLGVTVLILLPPGFGSGRHAARRFACQSNLKQIGLALQLYSQDNNGCLPFQQWGAHVAAYAKTDAIFQCPETSGEAGTNDYFFNWRFRGAKEGDIWKPMTLVLSGDSENNGAFEFTLIQLPPAWRRDEKSPSFRHLGTANYLFADGYVKGFKPHRVNSDFRVKA